MKTLELIREARLRNCKLDYVLNDSFLNLIGFRFQNKNTWHWFHVWEDGTVFFDHSYSMNTGKVQRGTTHRMRVNTSINVYNYK